LLDHVVSQGFAEGDKAVTKSVRDRLGRNPHRVALEVALSKTEGRFAERHPELHRHYFDREFLGGAAAPLLARALTRTDTTTGAQVARVWSGRQTGGATGHRLAADAEPAAADLLRWWEEELGRHEVFQAKLARRALERIAAAQERGAETADAVHALRTELA